MKDTLKSPPSERQTMRRASVYSICITTFFYLGCGGFGYAAFGDQTPGDLLTGFANFGPYWLINFANACVVLHLIGGYQVNDKNKRHPFFKGKVVLSSFSPVSYSYFGSSPVDFHELKIFSGLSILTF